jgi:hypothetical protein
LFLKPILHIPACLLLVSYQKQSFLSEIEHHVTSCLLVVGLLLLCLPSPIFLVWVFRRVDVSQGPVSIGVWFQGLTHLCVNKKSKGRRTKYRWAAIFFSRNYYFWEFGEIGGGIMYSALTDWSSDMKRYNGRDRFQKTERATCASQKCILKKSAVLLLQRFCDRICLSIISVVCAQTLLRELSFVFCKIRPCFNFVSN